MYGIKNNCACTAGGKSWTKEMKTTKNSTAISERQQREWVAKAKSRPVHACLHSAHLRVHKPQLLCPTPGCHPSSPSLHKDLEKGCRGSCEQGTSYRLLLLQPVQEPQESVPEILVWPLVNSVQQETRTLVVINSMWLRMKK